MANIPNEDIQARNGYLFADMENTPASEKEKPEYALKQIKAVFSQYANNKGDVPYSGEDGKTLDEKVDQLRLIAMGRQSAQQYKDYFTGGELPSLTVLNDLDTTLDANAQASRKGWFTGIWDIVSPIPNMMRKALGEFLKYDNDIKAYCVDADATSRELFRMNKEWVKYKGRNAINGLRKLSGLPVHNDATTDSYEALQDIKNEGGYKDRLAIAIEQAIQHTEDISDWKMSQKEKLFKDIFTIGVAFATCDYDETNCKVVWTYRDVKDFGCQLSYEKDYKDIQCIYWFEYTSLNRIREIQDKLTDGKKVGLTKEDFEQIANTYKDYSANANSIWYRDKDISGAMDFNVCTMHMRIFDVEKERSLEYKNKGNKVTRMPYREGYEKDKKYKLIENRRLKRYDVSWIVGTDFVWNYGWAKNQAYIGNKPTLGFGAYKTWEKPPIEGLVPIAHLFAISWINFGNKLLKSLPDFIAVNRLKIAQFSDGDKQYDPLLALKMLRQELVYFYDSDENTGGDNVPIKKIDGTKFEDIMSELQFMEGLLRQAEIITGISPMNYGVSPDPKLPVRNAMATMNSSNVTMSFLMNAVMVIKSRLAEHSIPMIANLINIDEKAFENYAKVIGEDDAKVIRDNRDGVSSLGIKLYPRPTDEMKQNLVEYAKVAMQQGYIDIAKVMNIEYHLYRGGNYLELAIKLDFWIRQEKKRQTEEKRMMLQEQAKGNEKAAQVQAQAQEKIQQDKMRAEQSMQSAKAFGQTVVDDNKAINDIKQALVDMKVAKGEDPTQLIADIQELTNQRKQQLQSV